MARFTELAIHLDPSYPADGDFHEFDREGVVGRGPDAFAAGAAALDGWRMHEGTGITVARVPLAVGATVTLCTRTLGLWLLFACRVTEIHDADGRYGFTYATLPGHPEQGVESFVLHHLDNDDVVLRIHAISRPATRLSKLAGPIGRVLQRRYASAYIAAVERFTAAL